MPKKTSLHASSSSEVNLRERNFRLRAESLDAHKCLKEKVLLTVIVIYRVIFTNISFILRFLLELLKKTLSAQRLLGVRLGMRHGLGDFDEGGVGLEVMRLLSFFEPRLGTFIQDWESMAHKGGRQSIVDGL